PTGTIGDTLSVRAGIAPPGSMSSNSPPRVRRAGPAPCRLTRLPQSNRKSLQPTHQGAVAVLQCRLVVQRDSLKPGQQPAERDLSFEPGQWGPYAVVNAMTES